MSGIFVERITTMDEEHRQAESGQGRKTERREHRKYHRFTEEFKREAVRLTQQPNKTVAGARRLQTPIRQLR
jgi:hypothetical protein